jgi:hypothetical protein
LHHPLWIAFKLGDGSRHQTSTHRP